MGRSWASARDLEAETDWRNLLRCCWPQRNYVLLFWAAAAKWNPVFLLAVNNVGDHRQRLGWLVGLSRRLTEGDDVHRRERKKGKKELTKSCSEKWILHLGTDLLAKNKTNEKKKVHVTANISVCKGIRATLWCGTRGRHYSFRELFDMKFEKNMLPVTAQTTTKKTQFQATQAGFYKIYI